MTIRLRGLTNERVKMLSAHVKKLSELDRNKVQEFCIDFEKLSELEDFIAYNRAYIKEITFSGKMKVGE